MTTVKRISIGKSKYQINLICTVTDEGLIVSIVGGEKPHVGAAAMSIPRSGSKDPSVISATTSVFALIGHKDDELAKPAAERIAKELNQPVVVVAGVHVDDASDDDIRKLIDNSMRAVELLLRKLRSDA